MLCYFASILVICGLRDYGIDGQLGLEKTPEEYVEKLVMIFREVRRVLRKDGTLWLNLGDSYNSAAGNKESLKKCPDFSISSGLPVKRGKLLKSLKSKNLIGIPWRVAFALQADSWYLRQDIIWHKPNPRPESATDRCTKSHEYIFLLSKSARYFYDAEAVKEESTDKEYRTKGHIRPNKGHAYKHDPNKCRVYENLDNMKASTTRNKRDVWTMTTKPYSEAHFATFPPELPEICIKAGCPEGGIVLDPFHGAGTTGMIALRLYRDCIGIEIKPEYVELSRKRIINDSPMYNKVIIEPC